MLEIAPEGHLFDDKHILRWTEISPSDCRIFKWLQKCCVLQQAFRADFYMHFTDLIRSKLHSFSSSLCLFLNVCSIYWSRNVKSSYIFCLRDQASDTHERKLLQTLLQGEVLALQSASAAGLQVFGVLSCPLGTRQTNPRALWKHLHVVLCLHQ